MIKNVLCCHEPLAVNDLNRLTGGGGGVFYSLVTVQLPTLFNF